MIGCIVNRISRRFRRRSLEMTAIADAIAMNAAATTAAVGQIANVGSLVNTALAGFGSQIGSLGAQVATLTAAVTAGEVATTTDMATLAASTAAIVNAGSVLTTASDALTAAIATLPAPTPGA